MLYFYLKKKESEGFLKNAKMKCNCAWHISTCSSWGKTVLSLQTVSFNLVTWRGGFLHQAHARCHAALTSTDIRMKKHSLTWNSSQSKQSFSSQQKDLRLLRPLSQSFCLFLLFFFVGKVILMDNIKNELYNVCIPLPFLLSVSTNVWPLTWLDRLIYFLGAAWKFYLDLWLVWSAVLLSTTVRIHALYTEVLTSAAATRENQGARLARWLGKAGGRVSQDCMQMLFRGPSAYLTRGCGT